MKKTISAQSDIQSTCSKISASTLRALSRSAARRHDSRSGGFTLVEITVVLAIAAVVTAITVGGFKEVSSSNKRVSCQTNLVQIYQASRQYAEDYGGAFPYYDPAGKRGSTADPNLGLWQLYTFAKKDYPSQLPPAGEQPIERYLRSSKVLHCPADYEHDNLFLDANRTAYNADYLSYQTTDDINATPSVLTDDVYTYQPVVSAQPASCGTPGDAACAQWKRQLLPYKDFTTPTPARKFPAGDTVVTWCKWHYVAGRGRPYDNVLFYDGSVQFLPREQVVDIGGVPTTLKGRDRQRRVEDAS